MKKFVRLLSLLLILVLAVCVFVACDDTPDDKPDDGKTPGNEDDGKEPGNEDPVDPTAKYTAVFKFIAPDGTELEPDVERRSISYNDPARQPIGYLNNITKFEDYVIIGWDSDGDGKADDGHEHVKGNMTIKAVFREKKMFTVKFYAADGEVCTELQVKEGTAVDMSKVTYDPVVGCIFKQWKNANSEDRTTLENVRGDAEFVAVFSKIDSVIPMVAKNTITVDGKKDPAYLSGAYLPINEERHADRAEVTYTAKDAQEARPKKRNEPSPLRPETPTSWITADAWLVWDGDYIYAMIEVADKSLTYRNPKYVQLTANAWLNDNVECYFNFEQGSDSEKNRKKLGLDALSQKLFANSIAVYGDNSTHYAEMEGAARSALGYYENGGKKDYDVTDGLTNDKAALESTDNVGVQYAETLNAAKNYSYRIELKLPAWTEGVPDKENYPMVDDNGRLPTGHIIDDLPDSELNGTKVPKLIDKNDASQVLMEYYRFTSGEKLKVGSFVRFALQINDLMVSQAELKDPNSGFYEGKAEDIKPGDLLYTTVGAPIYPPFVPCGHTQYDLSGYVTYSLGGEGDAAKWEVYELKGSEIKAEMHDAEGNVIVQGSEEIVVKTTK